MSSSSFHNSYKGGKYIRWAATKYSQLNGHNVYDVSDSWKDYLLVSIGDAVFDSVVVDMFSTAPMKRSRDMTDPQNMDNIYVICVELFRDNVDPYPIKRKDGVENKKYIRSIMGPKLNIFAINTIDPEEDIRTCVFISFSDIPEKLTLNYLKNNDFGLEEDDITHGFHIVSWTNEELLDTPYDHLPIVGKSFFEAFFSWDIFDPFDKMSYEIKRILYDPLVREHGINTRIRTGVPSSKIGRRTWEYVYKRVVKELISKGEIDPSAVDNEYFVRVVQECPFELELPASDVVFIFQMLARLLCPKRFNRQNILYTSPSSFYFTLIMYDVAIKQEKGIHTFCYDLFEGLDRSNKTKHGISYDVKSSYKVLVGMYEEMKKDRSNNIIPYINIKKDMKITAFPKEEDEKKNVDLLEEYGSDDDDAELDELAPGEELTKEGYVKGFCVDSEEDDEEDEIIDSSEEDEDHTSTDDNSDISDDEDDSSVSQDDVSLISDSCDDEEDETYQKPKKRKKTIQMEEDIPITSIRASQIAVIPLPPPPPTSPIISVKEESVDIFDTFPPVPMEGDLSGMLTDAEFAEGLIDIERMFQ